MNTLLTVASPSRLLAIRQIVPRGHLPILDLYEPHVQERTLEIELERANEEYGDHWFVDGSALRRATPHAQ